MYLVDSITKRCFSVNKLHEERSQMPIVTAIDSRSFNTRVGDTYNEETERCGVEGAFLKSFVRSWTNRGSRGGSQYSVSVTQKFPNIISRKSGIAKPSLVVVATEWHPPYESFGADRAEYEVGVTGGDIGVLAAAAWHADGVAEGERVPVGAWVPREIELDPSQIVDRVYEIAGHIQG
jgi:hypothetical protein